jgi:hypothetical protein
MTHHDTKEFHTFLGKLIEKGLAWINEEKFPIVQRDQPGGKVICSTYLKSSFK